MNWKSYAFCLAMLGIAVSAWLRPLLPAAADDSPHRYEYKLMPATSTGSVQFNAAGAQGWNVVGMVCESAPAGNGGFGCSPQTLLVRRLP